MPSVPMEKVLAVDLDGTLLHPEPEAIAVWSRSRYQYMSAMAARLLEEISHQMPVAIASARNAQSVKILVDQLPQVNFCGFVTENGLVARRHLHPVANGSEWDIVANLLPDWLRITGYEQCLGLIPPTSVDNPEAILRSVLCQTAKHGHIYLDRHKIFVYPTLANKLSGLEKLGLQPWMALGNDLNDWEMLGHALHPATLADAHEKVKDVVKSKEGGYCSPAISHAGTRDILLWIQGLCASRRSSIGPVEGGVGM
ncbi:MAG: HAD hydrolase family protein [Hormoscilla sp. SP5CHS1]|nr:HAD hydrolase family protein [Hormoscilla sp. SP12CHS1]MBC6456008.1 HAD hydrolase family protein [Hormoscilla sp. SP5CHS1]